ncbi:P-loop containing nucleoside triphosphate hydrolase protein [Aspergillus pseudonomiae]|uniref:P-loop containing nucleoside triphosphate hydrolase protein n=1 Tax=Aspergillus pseudonomiae TaxID=1506151 RepID=A0A5N7DEZ9_9EURO|nr:P-loop containing nucleoside triphosphate hydrolase protein [Aspergillus pseudonomiae]KAB8259252.1 P-loop containing nucleoside triphosphate hydrolase protein [Aspergillus pseudonomiae]KAE8405001.1 P-loop containing nucleoside triphosphate hydrolase protein [Aspergillus pseudonomiae]
MKAVLIVLESCNKEQVLMLHIRELPPEQLAGAFGKTLFTWIYPILGKGYTRILTPHDIPKLDRKLSSKHLQKDILRAWDQRAKPETTLTLPATLFLFVRGAFISPILARIFLIVFRYCQPVLINAAVRFVSNKGESQDDANYSYWLIVMASIIYFGLAASIDIPSPYSSELIIMIRSALIALLHHRALNVESGRCDNGGPITLMSVDVETLSTTGEMFHETWAYILEVVLGTTLLAGQIGWLCLVPLVGVGCSSVMSAYVARHLQRRQRNWNAATQKRMAVTTAMLQSIKSMKMLGISSPVKTLLSGLRSEEIQASIRLRWVMLAYNASANALGMFAPVITLVLYVLFARFKTDGALPAETAFTSIALLAMVTHPANMVMTIVPRAIASLANSERIMNYLTQGTNEDSRMDIQKAQVDCDNTETHEQAAILLADVTIQYPHTSKPTLDHLNFKINRGSIVMCAGPVGSGKTTLARALLGEIPLCSGAIYTSSKRIGICAQEPWLPNGSIKEVICGGLQTDETWYKQVLVASDLVKDLGALPDGDGTEIKFPGLNLSGGQRQRVALARVLYARCEIVILDDTFRALDGTTEKVIIDNLLCPEGIFRRQGTTALVITNSAQYLPLADHILILSDSKIRLQGSWDELQLNVKQIDKFMLDEPDCRDVSQVAEGQGGANAQKESRVDAARDLTRQSGDLRLYGYYLSAMGIWNGLFMLLCTGSYSFFITFSQYWLKWWAEAGEAKSLFYMVGYMMLALVAWISTNGTMWSTTMRISPKSGAVLHSRLLSSIVGAPVSYFSDNNIGVILNRFGEDIQLVDRQLPNAFQVLGTQVFKLLVQATILFIVNPMMAVTLPFCIIIVYFVQRVYLRTSRQLRFLEIESKSALYSNFVEMVDGLDTIRALQWQQRYTSDIVETIDASQKPAYLLFCLQRWLNLVLDLLIALVAVGLVALAVTSRGAERATAVGLSLNMIILANTTLLRLVESWTSLEVSLGAIARLRSAVTETPQEENTSDQKWYSPVDWPISGSIIARGLEASYSPPKLALENIHLEINAGQRLFICGRTGSGKSTLLFSFLRLLDSQHGSIVIDNIDISTISKTYLRRNCFITVPQDPFILAAATLRFNLDPDESLSDSILIEVLEKTRLLEHFRQLSKFSDQSPPESEALLDVPMSSLPPLSTGQQQLLSLSRALAHKRASVDPGYCDLQTRLSVAERRPILLLDEATSALDPDTEAVMQDVIEEEFTQQGYTVIIVAHRVSGMVKYFRDGVDTVIWMREGRIAEVVYTQVGAGLMLKDSGQGGGCNIS